MTKRTTEKLGELLDAFGRESDTTWGSDEKAAAIRDAILKFVSDLESQARRQGRREGKKEKRDA